MTPRDRDTTIRARVLAGETFAQVARDYGLTRQRISQIMSGCPEWDPEARKATRIAATRTETPATATSQRLRLPGGQRGGRVRVWSDTMIMEALQAAAEAGVAPSAVTWRYLQRRPSVTVIVSRFGSWNTACTAAGLDVHRAPYDRAVLSDHEMVGFVVDYLADEPLSPRDRGGIRGYTIWARTNHAPGPAALRARFGSWAYAKTLAIERLLSCGTVSPSPSPHAPTGGDHDDHHQQAPQRQPRNS